MLYKINKYYLLFVCIFYLFIFKDLLESLIGSLGYIDELIAALAIPIGFMDIVRNRKKRDIRIGLCIFVFTGCGLISSWTNNYQSFFRVALPDLFLCLKFWFAIYTGSWFLRKFEIEKYSKKISKHAHAVTIILFLLTCLEIISRGLLFGTSSVRYGMLTVSLFYRVPTTFAAICIFIAMVLFSVRGNNKGEIKYYIMLLLMMCSTLRSKAIGAAMMCVLIYYFVYVRKKKITFKSLLMFIPVLLITAWNQIEYYFFSSISADSARLQLLAKAFVIAKDYFPFGTGFGTYASYYSGLYYSPVYYLYNLSNVNGISPVKWNFISDTFWPMIIGQTGYLGTIFYIIALVILIRKIQKLRTYNKAYYMAGVSVIVYLLITSVAESAFVHPNAVPLALWIGVMLKKYDQEIELIK